jgi:hypothetical protein
LAAKQSFAKKRVLSQRPGKGLLRAKAKFFAMSCQLLSKGDKHKVFMAAKIFIAAKGQLG